ncbi:cbb3-type cytochrome c oxidase subunit I, partial [Burkholderia thailandensis]
AIPGADFVLHNSLFLIAHFHNAIIGGVVFGYLAGFHYWFPKAFGFKLDEKLGKRAFWFWFIGFYVSFVPLYVLGFMGMTRRLNHYDNPAWHPWLIVAACGVALIAIGVLHQVAQVWVAVRKRNEPGYLDTTGDPWNGRTLEWATSSPPPVYNFAVIPTVHALDELAYRKEHGLDVGNGRKIVYQDIHMPSNTGAGFVIGMLSLVLGFALVWHIWWLAIASFAGIVATVILYSAGDNDGYYIPAETVRKIEEKRTGARMPARPAEVELEVN